MEEISQRTQGDRASSPIPQHCNPISPTCGVTLQDQIPLRSLFVTYWSFQKFDKSASGAPTNAKEAQMNRTVTASDDLLPIAMAKAVFEWTQANIGLSLMLIIALTACNSAAGWMLLQIGEIVPNGEPNFLLNLLITMMGCAGLYFMSKRSLRSLKLTTGGVIAIGVLVSYISGGYVGFLLSNLLLPPFQIY